MKIGLQVPSFTWPGGPAELGATFRRIAQDADQAGLASLWVMDHFFQIAMVGPAENEMLEGYSALAFAAAVTDRITLGTMVTGVTYRHPGVLLKTVTTLDVLSGGRAWLGLGAAWNEQEHHGLGVPYPPVAERFERLEETLQIAERMFSGDQRPYEGTHYQLERPLNSPPPLSWPRPRILIGGSGEKKTLRLVAQYADACNLFDTGPQGVAQKLGVLGEHCARLERDPSAIEKTVLGAIALTKDGRDGSQTPAELVDRYAQLAAVGVDQIIVSARNVSEPGVFELFAELATGLAPIVPAGR